MSAKSGRNQNHNMQPQYEPRGGVRGKFFKEYQEGSNIVWLEPDVATVFRAPGC